MKKEKGKVREKDRDGGGRCSLLTGCFLPPRPSQSEAVFCEGVTRRGEKNARRGGGTVIRVKTVRGKKSRRKIGKSAERSQCHVAMKDRERGGTGKREGDQVEEDKRAILTCLGNLRREKRLSFGEACLFNTLQDGKTKEKEEAKSQRQRRKKRRKGRMDG